MTVSSLLFASLAAFAPMKGGENVAFLGDSITEDGRYITYLQMFFVLKNPGEGIETYNIGKCGDTVDGGLARWDWDDVPGRIDRLVVMFGMNDSKRETLALHDPVDAAETARRKGIVDNYRKNMTALADRVGKDCPRLVFMTPTPYDQYGPQRTAPMMGANEPMLSDFAGVVRELASPRGIKVIDLHRSMTRLIKEHPAAGIIADDRVHPSELGHYLMACICFYETGNGKTSARRTVDAALSDVGDLRHLPSSLPLPLTEVYREADGMWPVAERLNRDELAIVNLPPGKYRLEIDGISAGTFSAADLAKGINLASFDGENQRVAKRADAVRRRLQEIIGDFRSVRYLLKRAEDCGVSISDRKAREAFFARNRAEAASLSWGAWHLRCIGKMESMAPRWDELKAEELALRSRLRTFRPVESRLSVVPVDGGKDAAAAGSVTWDFPRTGNCHEGMAFSDGVTGVLVWGGEKELRLTVGRADMWDHRGGYRWTEAQNYKNIVSLWRNGEKEKLLSLFRKEPVKGCPRNPYMLPLGRVVVELKNSTLKRGILNTGTGIGEIELVEGGRIEMAMAKDGRLFAMRFPKNVDYAVKSIPATDFRVYEEKLRPLGFERAEKFDGASKLCGGFRWRLPADEPAWLFWERTGGECRVGTGRGEKFEPRRKDFAAIASSSAGHWRRFWREGARIKVPDTVLQRIFDYGMYRFGAMTDPDGVPAGLQGPWLEDDRLVPWNGDYHFNINVQECYSPAFRGGHFEHLKPLFGMLLKWRPLLRENARKYCGIADGYTMPHSVDDRGVCIGGFWTGTIDHASTAWMASYMFRYVKYARDREFLKNAVWDFMKGAMNVYLAMLDDDGGALALPLGPSPEWMGSDFARAVGRNPSFQLAACHRLAADLVQAAKMLGENPDPRWFDVMRRLPLYSRVTEASGDAAVWGNSVKDGIAIFEGVNLTESHRHHSHMAGIYPFDVIPRRGGLNRALVDSTYANWVLRGTGLWSGWCVPWASILHTDAGNAKAAVSMLHAWSDFFCDEGYGSHHNSVHDGFTNFRRGRDVMQMDGQCAAVTAVLELLAHEIDGKVEFFRGCPDGWTDVSFENLALSDGRRVNGRRLNGKIEIEYFK